VTEHIAIDVYLVDDGSTDGTADAVKEKFPAVHVLSSEGNLFWNRSMNWAFSEALQQGYQYYLWLNDDTLLRSDALSQLVLTAKTIHQSEPSPSIIVGSIQDPDTHHSSYGGLQSLSWWNPFKYKRVLPEAKPKACHTMNGNCVLISHEVTQKIGNLDSAFSHGIGDIDYGLRARRAGCNIWVAPGFLGECKNDSAQTKPWRQSHLGFYERFRRLNQPKGLPFNERKVFMQRHAGWLWPFYWGLPYARIAGLQLLGRLEKSATGS
ncbi:MAG: glycosyltransferase family 2 protein, partial [Phormidesmis sp.]